MSEPDDLRDRSRLASLGEELVVSEPDDLRDLPGLASFGDDLVAIARSEDEALAARRAGGRPRRARRSLRATAVTAALLGVVAATAAGATTLVLRSAVISSPASDSVPAEQATAAGTGSIAAPRAADPAGGPPWALRISRSTTGYTCTTVGQMRAGSFGIVGIGGRFRLLPGDVTDACGDGTPLLGARVVAADSARDVRSIVYGAGGPRLRRATLVSTEGTRALKLGARGTFVAALRGYPEDRAISVRLMFAGGRVERHDLGVSPGVVADPLGGQAWRITRLALGTRQFCAQVRTARPGRQALAESRPDAVVTPSACIDRRGSRSWAADARRFQPGQGGVAGFDRWTWRSHPPRTVLWGVAVRPSALRAVTVLGAGAPRRLTVSKQGTFAAVLPARVDPGQLRLVVRLAGGGVQRGRPGDGLVPDLVASRRAR